ncbi:MAG: TetR/AcrR family transcriptional regulator, partial [Mycobacterium sp.]
PEDALRAITLIDNFVLGSALDAAAPAAPWGSSSEVGPELAEALATGSAKADRAGDAFEFGVGVLLRGLAAP